MPDPVLRLARSCYGLYRSDDPRETYVAVLTIVLVAGIVTYRQVHRDR
jgi:hypothetical protein